MSSMKSKLEVSLGSLKGEVRMLKWEVGKSLLGFRGFTPKQFDVAFSPRATRHSCRRGLDEVRVALKTFNFIGRNSMQVSFSAA